MRYAVCGSYLSFILFSVLFCFSTSSIAQVDATYISAFGESLSAKVYGGYALTSLSRKYGSPSEETYIPNVPPYFGLGGSWKGIGGSISYGFAFANPHEKEVRSEYLDLQLHYYGDRIVFDFFGQRYKGFSLQDDVIDRFYPDIGVLKLGGYLQYNFNYRRFSFPAAFDQSKKQMKSAGTPMASVAFYYTKINADSLYTEEILGNRTNYVFGPSGGYAYTFVFGNNYFATGSLSFGLHACLDAVSGRAGVCPTFFPRISSGYNGETWALAVTAQYNVVYVSFVEGEDEMALGTMDGRIVFTRRFGGAVH